MKFHDWVTAMDSARRWATMLGYKIRVYSGIEYGGYYTGWDRQRVWYIVPTGEAIDWEARILGPAMTRPL